MTNEQDLADAWATLEPSTRQRRHIEARLSAWLDAHDTPLAAEWLGLFRGAPVAAFGLATVSAVALVVTTPMVWLARALL